MNYLASLFSQRSNLPSRSRRRSLNEAVSRLAAKRSRLSQPKAVSQQSGLPSRSRRRSLNEVVSHLAAEGGLSTKRFPVSQSKAVSQRSGLSSRVQIKPLLLFLFLLFSQQTSAQDAQILTQEFRFTDGIYTSFEEFQDNKPALSWEQIETELHLDKAGHLIRVSDVAAFDRETIWGISYQGVPYINLTKIIKEESLTWQESDPLIFANLQSRGKLCYFYYEGYRKVKVPITVYEPVTKRPLQTTYVENKVPVLVKKILLFENGDITNYRLTTFMELIQNDPQLWRTLNDLPEKEAREKMYKSLFIYNDRNTVQISN